jgi:hypothetical protein
MTKFVPYKSKIITIRPGNKHWIMNDGIISCTRAGFEISDTCPQEYLMIIAQAIDNNWIKPVANLFDHELTFEILSQ